MYRNIFDTHSHYADSAFDSDRDGLLGSLEEKGVKYAMLASTCTEDIKANAELSEKYGYIYSSAGFHPELAEQVPENFVETVKKTAEMHSKVKAVGEIGVDSRYEGYNRE